MARETKLLRVLLVMFLMFLVPESGLLYIVSLDAAASHPGLAHLRMPVYLAMLVGLLPMIVAVKVVFSFLGVVEHGDAFSRRTIHLLRQLELLIGITAAYLALGLAGVSIAVGQMNFKVLFAWIAAEIAALFLYTVLSLLERLFALAFQLRQDNELTI